VGVIVYSVLFSLMVIVFYSLIILFIATPIGVTYFASSQIHNIYLNDWWKLFITAVLQVALATGLIIFWGSVISTEFSNGEIGLFYFPSVLIVTILAGAGIIKILTAICWRSVLKIWGVGTILLVVVVPITLYALSIILGMLGLNNTFY